MKIYTKTGDNGTTSLYHQTKRVTKFDPRIDAVGVVDELSSHLGVVLGLLETSETPDAFLAQINQLKKVQRELYKVGSNIATPDQPKPPFVNEDWIDFLENQIDELDKSLEQLKGFILPSGGLISSHLHVARTVCRRAEREVVRLKHEEDSDDFDTSMRYLNRLSDYLFTLARYYSQSTEYA